MLVFRYCITVTLVWANSQLNNPRLGEQLQTKFVKYPLSGRKALIENPTAK